MLYSGPTSLDLLIKNFEKLLPAVLTNGLAASRPASDHRRVRCQVPLQVRGVPVPDHRRSGLPPAPSSGDHLLPEGPGEGQETL